jgi:hypothetical protein
MKHSECWSKLCRRNSTEIAQDRTLHREQNSSLVAPAHCEVAGGGGGLGCKFLLYG